MSTLVNIQGAKFNKICLIETLNPITTLKFQQLQCGNIISINYQLIVMFILSCACMIFPKLKFSPNRINNQRDLMVVRDMIGKFLLNLISVYAAQGGRSMNKKQEFYISLENVLAIIKNNEYRVVCGDFNGHVGKEVDGFDEVHGGLTFGAEMWRGRETLLKFANA